MVKLKIFALAAAALLSMAAKAVDEDFDTLVAAERRFAADAAALGISPAFRAHAARDALLISPAPRPAAPELARQVDAPGTKLEWQPEMAAVAGSGDLGFTTGPYVMRQGDRVSHGQYFTIWRRGADGTWRWLIDSGIAPFAKGEVPMPGQVVRIGGPGKAGAEAGPGAVEQRLDANATALAGFLAVDGLVLRPGGAAAIGDAGVALAGRGTRTIGKRLGGGQSAAGDLAYSYGEISGTDGLLIGHYVRVWRHAPNGWRVLVDQLAPLPRKAPPAS